MSRRRHRRSACEPCGSCESCCAQCDAWTELWDYPAGPVPDPPWFAPFGPGTELIASGAGTVGGAPAGVGVRALAVDTHRVTDALDTGTGAAALFVADAGSPPVLGAQGDAGTGQWTVFFPTSSFVTPHVGLTATVDVWWNDAGDWQVTLDALVYTGSDPGLDTSGGVVATVIGDGSIGSVTTSCEELS